jgi:hypothetical protein
VRERERHTHTHTHTHQRKGYRERKICSQVEEEEEFLQAESFLVDAGLEFLLARCIEVELDGGKKCIKKV